MNESRRHILDALRKRESGSGHEPGDAPESLSGPDDGPWIAYDHLAEQFRQSVEAVGGAVEAVADRSELAKHFREQPVYRDAERIVSLVQGVESRGEPCGPESPPRSLADVDVAAVEGRWGVAENGAVWVTEPHAAPRAVLFLCQHLVLTLEAGNLLPHMHAAYARLEPPDVFGVFISGPSKTADIEQSLVIGAHGPRSLRVYLVGTAS